MEAISQPSTLPSTDRRRVVVTAASTTAVVCISAYVCTVVLYISAWERIGSMILVRGSSAAGASEGRDQQGLRLGLLRVRDLVSLSHGGQRRQCSQGRAVR